MRESRAAFVARQRALAPAPRVDAIPAGADPYATYVARQRRRYDDGRIPTPEGTSPRDAMIKRLRGGR